jgi:RHS repeat-associated protein
VVVSNAAGGEVGRVQYDPYGEVLTSTLPADLTDRLFTGQRLDSSTGLYYYNARYYDPHLGRFIQPDSLVPDPLNPQAWNRFSYVYNNPVTYNDPSGHQPPIIGLMLIGAGVFALVVEANQISSYAERHDMSFWEAAVQADTYLDQAAMVEAAVEGALLTLLAAESIPSLLAGGGLVAMQYGVSANNPEIFVRGRIILHVGQVLPPVSVLRVAKSLQQPQNRNKNSKNTAYAKC